jgi:hypothetical protein
MRSGMKKFKIGDKVKCIDDHNGGIYLKKGKIYEVIYATIFTIILKNNIGLIWANSSSRFILYEDYELTNYEEWNE